MYSSFPSRLKRNVLVFLDLERGSKKKSEEEKKRWRKRKAVAITHKKVSPNFKDMHKGGGEGEKEKKAKSKKAKCNGGSAAGSSF